MPCPLEGLRSICFSSFNRNFEKISILIVVKLDVRIGLQCADNATAQPTVGKQFCSERGQSRIANIRVSQFDVFNCEIIGQMAGTYDFYTIGKYKNSHRRRHEIITMNERIGNEFFQHKGGDFGKSRSIYTLLPLLVADVPQHKTPTLVKNICQLPGYITTVAVVGRMDLVTRKGNSFYYKDR